MKQLTINPLKFRMNKAFAVLLATLVFNAPHLILAQTAEEEIVTLSEYVVETSDDKGYGVAHSIGTTRTNTRLIDIPQTISVITDEFIEDTGAVNYIDAAEYMSGISRQVIEDRFLIRGRSASGTFTDGIPDYNDSEHGTNPVLYQRVEFLKGPSAIVYGSHSSGGIVNRVRKAPQFVAAASVSGSIGSHDWYGFDADITGPLGKHFAYRVIGSFLDHKGDHPSFFRERKGVFPMLTWTPSDKTIVRFVGEFTSDERWWYKGHHMVLRDENGRFSSDSQTTEKVLGWTWSAAPSTTNYENDKEAYRISWEQQIGDNLRFNAVLNRRTWIHDRPELVPRGINSDNETVNRLFRNILREDTSVTQALDISYKFEAGPTKHRLLAILQYVRRDFFDLWYQNSFIDGTAQINIFDPISTYEFELFADGDPFLSRNRQTENDTFNISFQDEIKMFDERLIVVGGARYDSFDRRFDDFLRVGEETADSGDQWTYKAGVVGKIRDDISIYFNFAQTFSPNFSFQPDGTPLKPLIGDVNEIGIKTALWEGAVNLQLAFYDLVDKNISGPHPNPDLSAAGWRAQSDHRSMEGVEIDMNLVLFNNWRIMTSGHFISVDQSDNRVQRSWPKQKYGFFTRYDFTSGPLDGLQIGGGGFYTGSIPGDGGNSFFYGRYWHFDALVRYRLNEHTSFTLNVTNVANERYFNRGINRNIIIVNDPRFVKFKATYTW